MNLQKLFLLFLGLLLTVNIQAQIQILTITNGSSMKVLSGTTLDMGGLTLTPSADFTLSGENTLSLTTTVVKPTSRSYIPRVYQFTNTTATYSGSIVINYLDDELNTVPEADLKTYIHNGTSWMLFNSTVTPTSNFVTSDVLNSSLEELTLALPNASFITVNSPHSYQISDPNDNAKPVRIRITDKNGDPLPDRTEVSMVAYNQAVAGGATYYGNGGPNSTSTPAITLNVVGGDGYAETGSSLALLFQELAPRKVDNQDDPASWPRAYIKLNFAGDASNDASETIASINVRRENGLFASLGTNAETDKIKFNGISGSGYIVTSNTSENVKFTVKAADIADGYPGNINKAKVKFVLNPAGSTEEIVMYDTDGLEDGLAEVTFNVSSGTLGANPYNVQVFLEGFYRGRLNTTLTMHKTNSSEVISAGGDFEVSGSQGLYAGTEGAVARFGFGAKYNKTASKMQGKATLIFTSGSKTYQVTGSGIPVITMDATKGLATYNSKATISDITNDGADATVSTLSSPSGLRIEYSMTDAIPDIIAVKVYDATTSANTLWFSNKGTGSLSDKQSLTRGGITVKAVSTLATCGTPSGLTSTNVAVTSAKIGWTALTGATGYLVNYRVVGAAIWVDPTSGTAFTTNYYTLMDLTASTNYEWRIMAKCSTGDGSWSLPASFTTQVSCTSTGLQAVTSSSSTSTARLSWSGLTDAYYKLEYKKSTSTIWSAITPLNTTPTYSLTGLTKNTTYNWKVTTICSSVTGGTTIGNDFKTGSGLTYSKGLSMGAESIAEIDVFGLITVKAYPNPAHQMLKLLLLGFDKGDAQVRMTDLYGRLIQMREYPLSNGGSHSLNMNLIGIPKGVYYIRVIQKDKKAVTRVLKN